jgi:hypothetical protein
LPVLAVPGKAALACVFEPGFVSLSDRLAPSFVFIVRSHMADTYMAALSAGSPPLHRWDGALVKVTLCETGLDVHDC